MFKSIGKFIKALFKSMETAASALENTAGAVNELAYAARRSTEVVCDDIVEDLKIDGKITAAKRQRKLAKAEAKSANILAELAKNTAGVKP